MQNKSNANELEIQQHSNELSIDNFDEFEDKTIIDKHGSLFLSNARYIICGSSGCGKSNAFLALLLHPNSLRFMNIYIFSKSLYHAK